MRTHKVMPVQALVFWKKTETPELPEKNITELSLQERSKLFNQGTFYLACGMTIAQYEKMEKTNKVMFSREVVFSDLELD